jgi:hypothetical protein
MTSQILWVRERIACRACGVEQVEVLVHEKVCAVLEERYGKICTFRGSDKSNTKRGLCSLDLIFRNATFQDAAAELTDDNLAAAMQRTDTRWIRRKQS